MSKLGKGQTRTLRGQNPKLKIDLKETLGVDTKGRPALREALGQALLDKMLERTENGISRFGKAFKKYSKAYRESDEFKAAGKSNKVNLKLSGDMLGLMDVEATGGNEVTLSFSDSEEAAKAHGHITGGGMLPKRDFFALTAKDIREVKNEFSSDLRDTQSDDRETRDAALLGLIKKVRDSFDGES